jgi:predicted nucleotidyltransferase
MKSKLPKSGNTNIQSIEEFKAEFLERYKKGAISIILFGSFARGDAKSDSDIDLLTISKEDRIELLKDATSIAFSKLLKYGRYISPKVMDEKYHKKLLKIDSSFVRNIKKDGVLLYDRKMG